MITTISKMLAALLLALPVTLAASPPVLAQDGCISGREAQQAVESRRILPLNRAMEAAGVPADRVISRGAQVCDLDGRAHYRVNIMDEHGESRRIDLPASGD